MTISSTLKISIITPCLNRAVYIEKAINSVLAQNFPEFEHIIVDGGSTDGTLDVLKKYPHLLAISEPDQGMYDALNKGLVMATGDIIGFLNSDDVYASNIFENVVQQFQDVTLDVLAGNAVYFELNEQAEKREILRLALPSGKDMYRQMILSGCLMNACFFRKKALDNIDGFDPKFKIAGDLDFMIRLNLAGLKYNMVDFDVYYYYSHEDSLTMALDTKKLEKILLDNFILAEKYARKEIPIYIRELLSDNCVAIGAQLADKYLEKGKFDKIIKLGKSLEKYNPTWTQDYIQLHRNILPAGNAKIKIIKGVKSFLYGLKKGS
jgi:glycosyltransferase involved in cell wall biosynthesis